MKKVIMTCLMAMFVALSVSAAEITLKELPSMAQKFIGEYFAKDQIRKIDAHHHRHGNTYSVLFTDGSKVRFNAAGQWTKIKLRNDSIPVEIIPEYITTYIWDNYPNEAIMSIETEGEGHEVELSSGTELTFNPKTGKVRID